MSNNYESSTTTKNAGLPAYNSGIPKTENTSGERAKSTQEQLRQGCR